MKIELPQKVDYIIKQLINHGYEAFAVGGCVRDSILLREPEDWDITTSAKPLEVKKIFYRTIDTGIQHGTVTVMLEREGYEVTTYRIDGEYEDNRRPKSVEFTANLAEDLKRRDFTINAMAYNEEQGIVDIFGGLKDIEEGVIRCVGSARERFEEDALRILRAFRFSAQLGFYIEEETLMAAKEKAENLRAISAERIRAELNKLLLSPHPDKLIDAYKAGITHFILPEFDRMMETEQNNPHHIYSVGIHTIKAIENAWNGESFMESPQSFSHKDKLILRLTMLLHDVEKPNCKTEDEKGEHFFGHAQKGAQTARNILKRLKFDNETIETVYRLVKWHDYPFTLTPGTMRRAVNTIGEDIMDLLFEVKRADISAKSPEIQGKKYKELEEAYRIFLQIQKAGECTSLKMLAVNGKDLIELGFKPGVKIGEVLNSLLERVLEKPELNEREILLGIAKQYLNRDLPS